MNKVIIIGNLTRDPEVKQTSGGHTVTAFTVAVKRRTKSEGAQQADFINCIAWNQLGELVGKWLTKGKKCAVVGSLSTRSYEAQDGSKRYVTEVVAEEVEFLSAASSAAAAPAEVSEMVPVDDGELPF